MTQNLNIEIGKIIQILKQGGTILYPTDTIWGIGCDATNSIAIKAIYNIKNRERNKSMLILVNDIEMLKNYVRKVPEQVYAAMEAIQNPLTIIYPEGKNLAPNLLAEDGSIGIRIVKDEFCQKLIKEFGKPIVSTSANLSGKNPPLGYFDISDDIKTNVNYIVPLRLEEFSPHKQSNIIKINMAGDIEILR